ncbi:MAG: hypothetical protein MZV70_46520 [Desulfobacterales bacterium]|nr:hypothetical protein [Desulfobacterales bacterium]
MKERQSKPGKPLAAAAFRMAYLAVASGWVDIAMAVGLEKYTDRAGDAQDDPIYQTMDYDYEVNAGTTPMLQAGLLMQRYLYEHPETDRNAFGMFPIIAHQNAVNNPNAMFRNPLSMETYKKSSNLGCTIEGFRCCPVC